MDASVRTAHHGQVEATYPTGSDGDPLAVPGVHREIDQEPGITPYTLEVNGELFALRPDNQGGTDYAWLSGPNVGYGFGVSPTPHMSLEAHRASIRAFLAEIDPTTGYIQND